MPPVPGLTTTKRSVSTFFTKSQALLNPVSSSSFLMLSIYMHYLKQPLHRIKSILQEDPQLLCSLTATIFKVDVGSPVANIFEMDFVM